MWKWVMKNKILTLMLVEAAVFLLYVTYALTTYSDREIVFSDNDMQVLNTDWSVSPGTYWAHHMSPLKQSCLPSSRWVKESIILKPITVVMVL